MTRGWFLHFIQDWHVCSFRSRATIHSWDETRWQPTTSASSFRVHANGGPCWPARCVARLVYPFQQCFHSFCDNLWNLLAVEQCSKPLLVDDQMRLYYPTVPNLLGILMIIIIHHPLWESLWTNGNMLPPQALTRKATCTSCVATNHQTRSKLRGWWPARHPWKNHLQHPWDKC